MIATVLEAVSPWGLYLLAAVGVTMAALANGMETGLYRVNRVRLRLEADRGNRRARTLMDLLADLRGQIIVCLIFYNGGTYLTTIMVTTLVKGADWVESAVGVEIIATAILAPLFFVFTDVTPKNVFALEANRLAYPLAVPMRWAGLVLRTLGVIPVLKKVSDLVIHVARRGREQEANPFTPRQRLRALIREGLAEGVITGYQDELAEKVLALRDRMVGDVMIPMRHVAAVPADVTQNRFTRELARHSYSRLPVYENHRGNVVGIVHVNDVLARDGFDVAAVMRRDVVRLPTATAVAAAMVRMRRSRAAMAVVTDDKDRAVGIVTIKDLVEEIVGDLAAW
ncbi:MAG: DUF21 domain-containing protein [Planctomycetes bacterium]|nr:DUF21 domain-containing protein [Planctomycetota bacterium]